MDEGPVVKSFVMDGGPQVVLIRKD